MTSLSITRLSNEVLHDLEKALENAQTDEEVAFWEERIDSLEMLIEQQVLHTNNIVENIA